MKERTIKRKERGITLIALVITIIVLLILAGVSIAMLTGENGILTQAQKSQTQTEIGKEKEDIALAYNGAKAENNGGNVDADDLNRNFGYNDTDATATGDNPITVTFGAGNQYTIDANGNITGPTTGTTPPTTGPETDDDGFYTANSTVNGETTGSAMNPIIPAGFKPIDENGANWGDGTSAPEQASVENGLVIEDKSKNQFVWIPVTGEYKRNTSYEDTDVSAKAYTDTGYLPDGMETGDNEDNENAESSAVTSKGGFYISRYEAGKEGTDTLVSKSGATVWNSIAVEDDGATKGCKTVSKEFIDNDNVKSALCSGIQWDMTMAFVNGKQDGSSDADKTYNVTTYKSSRHTGSRTTSGQNPADRVCNIFDLEGNYWEYVAEKSSYYEISPFVYRGGYSDYAYPASYRDYSFGTADSYFSFRFVLYVM